MSQTEVFEFGRGPQTPSTHPVLPPDLARSYQQPFYLRIHPNKWEFVNGKWALQIERSHIRPGVGGVGGKESKLDTYDDTALLRQWANHGDRRWLVIPNGDQRLRGIVEPDGNFLRSGKVSVIHTNGRMQEGSVILGYWERITDDGRIIDDTDELSELSMKLAKRLFDLDGPPAFAVSEVKRKYSALLNELESTSQKSRGGGTDKLKRRIVKLKRNLAVITGDESYLEGLPEVADAPKTRRQKDDERFLASVKDEPPQMSDEDMLKALLARMSPEQVAALMPKGETAKKADEKKAEKKP